MPSLDRHAEPRTAAPDPEPGRPNAFSRARAAAAGGLRRLGTTRLAAAGRRRPKLAVAAAAALAVLAGTGFAAALYGVPEWTAPPEEALDVAELTERARAKPRDARTQLLLGHAHFAKRQPKAALDAYARALDLDAGVADEKLAANLVACFGRDAQRRAEALVAKHGLTGAAEGLARLSKDRRYGVRWGAVRTLDKIGRDPRSVYVNAYAADLSSPDCDVRRRAAEKLAKIGDRGALAAIRAAQKEDEKTGGWFRGTCLGKRGVEAEKAILARR
jgi:hypothetical protein